MDLMNNEWSNWDVGRDILGYYVPLDVLAGHFFTLS